MQLVRNFLRRPRNGRSSTPVCKMATMPSSISARWQKLFCFSRRTRPSGLSSWQQRRGGVDPEPRDTPATGGRRQVLRAASCSNPIGPPVHSGYRFESARVVQSNEIQPLAATSAAQFLAISISTLIRRLELWGGRGGPPYTFMFASLQLAHFGQKLAVRPRLGQPFDEQFHGLDRRQRVQHLAQNPNALQIFFWN